MQIYLANPASTTANDDTCDSNKSGVFVSRVNLMETRLDVITHNVQYYGFT